MEYKDTAFVTASDIKYFPRAEMTISELRKAGKWEGDIVLIAIDFQPSEDFLKKYNVILHPVKHIDTNYLVEQSSTSSQTTFENGSALFLSTQDFVHLIRSTTCSIFHAMDV